MMIYTYRLLISLGYGWVYLSSAERKLILVVRLSVYIKYTIAMESLVKLEP